MRFVWFRRASARLLKVPQIKERGPNFWGEPILLIVWVIWSSLLYLNFKGFIEPNSLSFIRYQCIRHDRGVPMGEPVLQKVWLIWSPLLYLNFKSFMDSISGSFVRFECLLPDSGVFFSEFWNFYKFKRVDLISGGNQFCRKAELFGPHFCISILKLLWTQFLRHLLDFNALCLIQESFSQSS